MADMSVETAKAIQQMANGLVDAVQLKKVLEGKYEVTLLFAVVGNHDEYDQVEVKPGTVLREKLHGAAEAAAEYYAEQIENGLEASK